MVMLPDARTPEGLRLYAIGDVHGRLDLIEAVHGWIRADLARRPPRDWRVIHLGDYVDRGEDSFGVLKFAQALSSDPRQVFLLGNHDRYLTNFLALPETGDFTEFDVWLANGGEATLNSMIGDRWVRAVRSGSAAAIAGLAEQTAAVLPEGMLDFLRGLDLMQRHGDYLFVHAGINPEVPLDQQNPEDLIWIRWPFLSSKLDHGVVVVHGHTPTQVVEVLPNRIGIDTGGFYTNQLSCLVLDGATQALLGPDGPEPAGP